MWIKNNDKERTKSYLKSDIESNITNIKNISNCIRSFIPAINRAASGTPSGQEQNMIDDCHRAIEQIEKALQSMYASRSLVDQINTMEWIDDESY